MQLVDKTIQILSELQEIARGQLSLHPGVNNLVIILEDLQSLLTDSIRLDSIQQGQLKDNDIEQNDREDQVNDSTKQSLTINMESALEACKSISAKNKSGIFKKALHFIKNKLLDDPEETLNSRNSMLWTNMLQVRVDLKKNNYAINAAQILQEKAKKGRKIINQGQEEDTQQKQPSFATNTMLTIKNKDNKNCGEILDEKSSNNRLSFETPLPPSQNIPCVTKLLNPSNDSQNTNQNEQSSSKEQLETSNYELEPIAHEKLQEKQDEIKQISFKGVINFKGESSTDFFSFKRQLFSCILMNGDLGRISRNHASLRAKRNENDQISYFLVNHSPNGCSILKEGQSEWIRIKEIGAEIQITQQDIIGILFDSATLELLLGYKFCVSL